jgi:hypothetical protein
VCVIKGIISVSEGGSVLKKIVDVSVSECHMKEAFSEQP